MTKQLSTATPSLSKGFIGVEFISRKVNFRVVRSALHWFKVMWFRTHLALKLLRQFGSSKTTTNNCSLIITDTSL